MGMTAYIAVVIVSMRAVTALLDIVNSIACQGTRKIETV